MPAQRLRTESSIAGHAQEGLLGSNREEYRLEEKSAQ
jgi:hypothetical protein